MIIKNIGNRGILFCFDELGNMVTHVYVIIGKSIIFVLDTYLGPAVMAVIMGYIRKNFGAKPVVVFNSHFHWDHIWGNCAFPDSLIISHTLCRRLIFTNGEKELHEYSNFIMGDVRIVPPNMTFEQKICFPDEELEFFHTPGHTEDSASVWDNLDRVLFVGDNIEAPIPYLCTKDIDTYISTLQNYMNFPFKAIVAGHFIGSDTEILEKNMEYFIHLQARDTKKYEFAEYRDAHLENMKILGI